MSEELVSPSDTNRAKLFSGHFIEDRVGVDVMSHGSCREFITDLEGNEISRTLLPSDVFDGGLRFLTQNHIAVSQLSGGVVQSIPDLFNQRQMQVASHSLKVRNPRLRPQDPQELFAEVDIGTLDYIFNEPIKPGPTLTWTITHSPSTDLTVGRKSDLEVAMIMKERPTERHKLAPYAYQKNGKVFAEYRDILKKYENQVQPDQYSKDSTYGNRNQPPTFHQKKKNIFSQQRVEHAASAHWNIHLKVPQGHRIFVRCSICKDEIDEGRKAKHANVMHDIAAKSISWEIVPQLGNTLQLKFLSADTPHRFKKEYAFPLYEEFYPERSVVEEIAVELVDFYQRWPCIFDENSKMAALAIASERVRRKHGKQGVAPAQTDLITIPYPKPAYFLPADPTFDTTLHGQTVSVEITVFEPVTLKSYRVDPYFQPHMMCKGTRIPPTPDHIIWTSRLRKVVGSREIPENDIESNGQVLKAIQLAKYISHKLSGSVIDKLSLDRVISYYRSFYTNAPVSFENFDTRHTLFNVKKKPELNFTDIRPHFSIRSMVEGRLPRVVIHSLDTVEIARVLNQGTAAFLRDGDPLSTWKALGEAADALNIDLRDGTPREPSCKCNPETFGETFHHCERCLRLEICGDMSSNADEGSDVQICRRCVIARAAQVRSPLYRCREKLRINIKNEARLLLREGELAGGEKPTLWAAWENVQKPFEEDDKWKYVDQYSDGEPLEVPQYSPYRGHRQLMTWSPDKALPYIEFRDEEGSWVRKLHYKNNIYATTVGNNMLKNNYLPGTLHLAAVALSYKGVEDQSVVTTEQLHNILMECADEIHLVNVQLPYSTKTMLQMVSGEKAFEESRQEWIQGAASSLARRKKYAASLRYIHRYIQPPEEWTGKPERWEYMNRIVEELEKLAGYTLRRSDDGCPYPGHPSSMPRDWGFWTSRLVFTERDVRMWMWCNGGWPQVDTADTLFLDACKKCLQRPEYFNLPRCYWIRHPDRVVFGHRTHKIQLRTGWKHHRPETLKDYDESLDNVDFDSACSNWFRSDATEEECAKALDHLLTIKIPQELYNPSALLRPYHRHGQRYKLWPNEQIAHDDGSRNSTLSLSALAPIGQDALVEDNGAETVLDEFDGDETTNDQEFYRQRIIAMFVHHNDAGGIPLSSILEAAHDQIGMDEWRYALSQVADVERSPHVSIWVLRDEQKVMIDSTREVLAVFVKPKESTDTTEYFIAKYGMNPPEDSVEVSWDSEHVYKVDSIVDQIRSLLERMYP